MRSIMKKAKKMVEQTRKQNGNNGDNNSPLEKRNQDRSSKHWKK